MSLKDMRNIYIYIYINRKERLSLSVFFLPKIAENHLSTTFIYPSLVVKKPTIFILNIKHNVMSLEIYPYMNINTPRKMYKKWL
jgi:hypothetical protein